MRTLILCEGKTDAILISYLLCKISNWEITKPDKKMRIDISEQNNESAYWYRRNDDKLLICGVGGKDRFSSFFAEKLYDIIINYPKEETFDKVIVIHDKDTEEITTIERKIKGSLYPIANEIQNNKWITNEYIDSFGKLLKIDLLGIVIPFENEGALETVLLASMKEKTPERHIVENSEQFVDDIKEYASDFIDKPRMELKAKLGVTFAILSPMKVFSFIDEQIKAVQWEKYDYIKQVFCKVLEL